MECDLTKNSNKYIISLHVYIICIYTLPTYTSRSPPPHQFFFGVSLDLGFGSRFCSCASSTSINTLTGNSQIQSMMTLKPWWGSQVDLFFFFESFLRRLGFLVVVQEWIKDFQVSRRCSNCFIFCVEGVY